MWSLRILRILARFAFRAALVMLQLALLLPWGILVGAGALLRGARRALRLPGQILRASRDRVRCSRCRNEVSLLGRWRCPACKAIATTHAWAPCRVCGTDVPAGYIACPTPGCGETIANP